jgi:hypothetical protein
VRLVYQHQQQPTFSLLLHLPHLESEEQLALLREQSRRTYCRPAVSVEQKLLEALGKAIAASQSRQQQSSSTTAQADGEAKSDAVRSEAPRPFEKANKRKKGLVTSFDQYPYTDVGQGEMKTDVTEEKEAQE